MNIINSCTTQKIWESQESFEKIQEKIASIPKTPEFKHILNEISKLHRRTILDVGCGTGRWTFYLDSKGYEAIGIDFAPKILRRVKTISPGKHIFIVADARKLPFISGCIDFIISLGVIEHFPDNIEAIREFYRVLRFKGGVFITVPNILCFPHVVTRFIKKKLNKWELGYECSYSINSLKRTLEKSGFKIAKLGTLDFERTLKMLFPGKIWNRCPPYFLIKKIERLNLPIGFMVYAIAYK